MTSSTDQESASIPQDHDLPDGLPPVQPPSAGFIIQLFVVPGLIVLAVVAVWAAFGRIAVGEQDWRALVEELQSPNAHIRNRAMYGLAQLLEQDRRRGSKGLQLASNSEITTNLSKQLTSELKTNASSKEGVVIQEYLTRTMGLLDPTPEVMAALRMALASNRDVEVRKSGVISISLIAGRAIEAGAPLDDQETVDALVELSEDNNPLMRQTAAFALGLFKSPQADRRLRVLLGDSDWMTCVNAAIALARNGSTEGLSVFKRALTSKTPEDSDKQVEHFIILTNTLKAISQIAPQMSEADKSDFREVLNTVVNNHAEVRIRVDAQNALQSLK